MFIYDWTRDIVILPVQLCETNVVKAVADTAQEQLTNQNVCFKAVARELEKIIQT